MFADCASNISTREKNWQFFIVHTRYFTTSVCAFHTLEMLMENVAVHLYCRNHSLVCI